MKYNILRTPVWYSHLNYWTDNDQWQYIEAEKSMITLPLTADGHQCNNLHLNMYVCYECIIHEPIAYIDE